MVTMNIDTDTTTTRESHSASAIIALLSRETGEDDITQQERSWSAKSDQTFTWRPDRLRLGWFWLIEAGEWVCDEAVLTGARLKKDGSIGVRREEKYLINRWGRDKTWNEDAPAYARELEERFRPTSTVSMGESR